MNDIGKSGAERGFTGEEGKEILETENPIPPQLQGKCFARFNFSEGLTTRVDGIRTFGPESRKLRTQENPFGSGPGKKQK